MEDSFLNFHLHLNDISLQIGIHFVLGLFNKFLDVVLLENILKSFPVRDLEVARNAIKIQLEQ
jgi:hypothetical protein